MRLDIVPGAMISQVTDLLYPVSDIHMEMFGVIVDISKDCLAVCLKRTHGFACTLARFSQNHSFLLRW